MNLNEAQAAKQSAMATVEFLDKLIKGMQPKKERRRPDYSAIEQHTNERRMKKFRKSGLI